MTPNEIQLYVDSLVAKRESYTLVYLALAPAVTLGLYHLIPYLKTKGQNLATKEDVVEITDKIESTKNSYNEKLEKLRSELSTRCSAPLKVGQEPVLFRRLVDGVGCIG